MGPFGRVGGRVEIWAACGTVNTLVPFERRGAEGEKRPSFTFTRPTRHNAAETWGPVARSTITELTERVS